MREIAASGLSVEDVVRKAGAKDLEIVPDPIGAQGRREVVTVIMASAAAIAASTPLIVKVLQTVLHRPIKTRRRELVPALDAQGNAIRDIKGEPVMAWRDIEEVQTPLTPVGTPKTAVEGLGFHIGIG